MVSRALVRTAALSAAVVGVATLPSTAPAMPFINNFATIGAIASTVPSGGPASGDQNPYGVAVVPNSVGKLARDDLLVANFNNAANQQGTGSSILEISPAGKVKTFAVVARPTATRAVGLTTALAVLRSGFVIVGSLPAPGGKPSAARSGALTILDSQGRKVQSLADGLINGPWDMTAVDHGTSVVLFVTNVLNGTVAHNGANVDQGTVLRIVLRIPKGQNPSVSSEREIATGFREHTDPNALVVGPTGVALGSHGMLYVADTARNRIAAIPDALSRTSILGGGGHTVAGDGHLRSPLGVAIAPGGDILSVNGADGNIVETTPDGHQTAKTLVPNGAGDLFGLAVAPGGHGVYFIDDAASGPASNSLELLH